jgi:hypothetical protein
VASSTTGKVFVSAWGVWCPDEGKFVSAFLSLEDAERHADKLNDPESPCSAHHEVLATSLYALKTKVDMIRAQMAP